MLQKKEANIVLLKLLAIEEVVHGYAYQQCPMDQNPYPDHLEGELHDVSSMATPLRGPTSLDGIEGVCFKRKKKMQVNKEKKMQNGSV